MLRQLEPQVIVVCPAGNVLVPDRDLKWKLRHLSLCRLPALHLVSKSARLPQYRQLPLGDEVGDVRVRIHQQSGLEELVHGRLLRAQVPEQRCVVHTLVAEQVPDVLRNVVLS